MNARERCGCYFVAAMACIALVLTGCGQRGRVLPKPGDELCYKMYFEPGGRIRETFLLVRCVSAAGDNRTLRVSYLTRTGWNPAYSVLIRYGASDPVRKVEVRDNNGARVARGRTIQGVPVPFSTLLFLPGDELPKANTWQDLSDGWSLRNGYGSRIPTHRPSYPHLYLNLHRNHQSLSYADFQEWSGKDWLWTKLIRESSIPGDPRFDMLRCVDPTKHKRSSSG